MRKKLHRIYWLGILITLLMAAVVILLMITMRVSDTRRTPPENGSRTRTSLCRTLPTTSPRFRRRFV